jgi:hypothetical protein
MSQRVVITILRALLPPNVDNERAAVLLRTQIGKNDKHIEWVAIRPDALCDENKLPFYKVHASPIRNAIFISDATSTINVASFMTELISNENI